MLIHAPTPPAEPRAATPPVALMGILNLTPDSFSDGGRFTGTGEAGGSGLDHVDVDAAVAAGLRLAREGAAWLDLGGESTRPGAARVPAQRQIRRVIPTLRALRQALDADPEVRHVALSIDTTRAAVAEAAVEAGAAMINDVSGGREEPELLRVAADSGVALTLMHMQGEPGTMQDAPTYGAEPGAVVGEVADGLRARRAAALEAGVAEAAILLDPGIGFGKTLEHNLALLHALPALVGLGAPVLLGVSRKSFIAGLFPDAPPPVGERLPGSLAAALFAAEAGVRILRVHDVAAHRQALRIAEAIRRGSAEGP